jgi:hypothetical protein
MEVDSDSESETLESNVADMDMDGSGNAEEDDASNANSPPPSTVVNTEIEESTDLSSPQEVSEGKGNDSDGVVPAKYAARKRVVSKKRRKVSQGFHVQRSVLTCTHRKKRGGCLGPVSMLCAAIPPNPFQRSARRLQ